MTAGGAHLIVFANEKGGTGKSTTAVHVGVALARLGFRVAALDLDVRQRSFTRYLENRSLLAEERGLQLPAPAAHVFDPAQGLNVIDRLDAIGAGADFVIVDTAGRDDVNALAVIVRAETLVTPMNDSFVDLDLIGRVDPRTMTLQQPSFYARLIWDARRQRQERGGSALDWIVLRNRLQHIQAGNMKRVGSVLEDLAGRVGFRVIPGLSERVVYRELFPQGLTVLDLDLRAAAVAARYRSALRELETMMDALGLPDNRPRQTAPAMVPETSFG